MAMPAPWLEDLRRRAGERTRALALSTRERWAPAQARFAGFTRAALAHEAAPLPLGRPGLAEKITAGLFILLLAAILIFLAVFDWNWLRGPIGAYASARWNRQIEIRGDLDVDLFRWSPRAVAHGLRVGPPAWGPRADTADIDELRASAKWLPLLAGHVDMPEVRAVRPRLTLYRDAGGRESWRLGAPSGRATKLPLMRRFLVEDGRIDFTDVKRRIVLHATVNSRETAGGGAGSAFRLEGAGTLNGNPLKLTVTGGPLINVRRDRPYSFTADLRGGSTTLIADGQITRPFDLGRFTANLTAQGTDLADLYYLTTLTMPNTPPYRIRGRLSRAQHLWSFEDFAGRVGDSDLSGDLSVRTGGKRPYLKATLRSRSLDMDDMMAVTGGAPSTAAGETASPEQRAMAAHMRAQGRLLPDARLDVKRLRSMDADVSFRAGSVKRNTIQLRAVHVNAALKDAVLRLEPFSFTFSRGSLNGAVRIDGRKATPFTSADLTLKDYPLGAVVPARGGIETLSGTLNAHAKLAGSGASLHEAASHASGSLRAEVPSGRMRQAFAELLGINVGRGLYLLLSKDPRETPIRCAAADFDAAGGMLRVRRMVIDTGVVVSHGSGTVNLATERMHFELDGSSKKPRLLRLWAPITVDGPLASPRLGVKKSEVVKQGAVAGLLGAVVNPLAAIIPFLEPGKAKDVDCAALLGS